MEQNNYGGVLQKPLNTGFNGRSTAQDVIKGIDLTGKTVIVTGGHGGIGLETTKAFAGAGATVIVPARDMEKARKNLAGIPNVETETLDLMDTASIDAFAERFLASGRALHILVNNAGIMWAPLRRDAHGNESQLATNHLGHFRLTARLWPALKNAGGARVVSVSSFAHEMSPFRFDDPNYHHRPYESMEAYGQSKTANNLFAVELDKRGQAFGVRAYSLHPGAIYGTDLAREAPAEIFIRMGTFAEDGTIKPEVEAKLKTVPQGAATSVWCATSPLLRNMGGVYCEDADIAEPDNGQIPHSYEEPATMRGVLPGSLDGADAQRLWKWSEEVTGVPFAVE